MDLTDFLNLLQTGSVGVTLLIGYLFYEERREHRETRRAYDELNAAVRDDANDLTREVVTAVQTATGAINKIAEGQEQTRTSMAKIAEGVTVLSVSIGNRGRHG